MSRLATFVRDERGGSAAEFALTLPLLLLMLFGIIDVGRFMYEYNLAEKATQMGVRYAVSTAIVPSGLSTYSFATQPSTPVLAGEPVPTSYFSVATCDNASCSCTGSACGAIGYSNANFRQIVDRMKIFYPYIGYNDVTVEYRNVGLGYAGDPGGSDIAALVTVRLRNISYRPLTGMLFKATIPMGAFSAALTLEDGAGSVAN
jgi:hypothetical protein